MKRSELVNYLNDLLKISEIPDYCENGLQVEWNEEIKKIWLAVDACMATYLWAQQQWCQFLLSHHWMIWWWLKSITWVAYKQVKYLIENWINLYCAHLPLDKHPEYWNNICLSNILKLKNIKEFWLHKWIKIWFKWEFTKALSNEDISAILEKITWREPSYLSFWKDKNKSVWIISGWASIEDLIQAKQEWLDCYITWEWNHSHYHLALEEEINIIYLWHYHSEKIWVIALWEHLKSKFWLEIVFIDEPSVF